MKKLHTLITLIICSSFTFGQSNLDTVSVSQVGLGIYHTEILEPNLPLTIDVLEIDLTNQYNKIETIKANDKLYGNETVSSMAERNSYEGHQVVGSINGDFYSSGGLPIGTQIVNGEILKYSTNFSTIGFSANNNVSLGTIGYSGEIIAGSEITPINTVNNTRNNNFMVLYNSYMGSTTGTNQYGTELLLEPIDDWIVNDTVECIAQTIETNQGSMTIPKGSCILSGHGTSASFIADNISVGDTVKIVNRIFPSVDNLTQMMSGYPRIVVDGENYAQRGYNEEGGPSHTFQRHPRTAVGFSADSTKLYFITVDGRGYSQGITLPDLADLMIEFGVATGVNLDGGGSTTMYVRGNIVNVPSDGSERAVANSLVVVSTAPQTDSLAKISVTPTSVRLFKSESIKFNISGFDPYFNPLSIDENDINYSLSSEFGEINENGKFTAGDKADTGYVFFDYQELKDTAKIIVKTLGKIDIEPKSVLTDTIRTINFKVNSHDEDGIKQNLENTKYIWEVEDSEVGSIDENGIFHPFAEGSTKIFVKYESLIDTAKVKVEVKEGQSTLNSFSNTSDFAIGGEGLNLGNCGITIDENLYSEGSESFNVKYEFTGSSVITNYVYLTTNIPIEGVPDSIAVDLKTNGNRHQVRYLLKDDDNEEFLIAVRKWADNKDEFDVQPGAFKDVVPANSSSTPMFNFPVRLKQIQIKLGDPRTTGEVFSDSLYIDNLRIAYPGSVTDVEQKNFVPEIFVLEQNYPNPFNPTTNIGFTIPETGNVKVNIYNVLGQRIKELYSGRMNAGIHKLKFNASNLTSGIYLYSVNFEGNIQSKKMLLMK